MYAKHIKPYIIHGERSLAEAHWKLTAKDERTLFVVDQNEKIAGFLKYDYKIPKYTDEIRTMTAYEACQKNFSFYSPCHMCYFYKIEVSCNARI